MDAAQTYASLVDAVGAQRERVHGKKAEGDVWGGVTARRFRLDPLRELDSDLQIIASYLEQQDILIDVGGGAGRFCLPLALRCREARRAYYYYYKIHVYTYSYPTPRARSSGDG